MDIQNLDPKAAFARMQSHPDHVFIDVRTPMEYAQGHPAGAKNIPWAMPDPASGMMAPNPSFLEQVQQLADAGKTLFVSCQSGGRSMGACRDLQKAGYTALVNVDGGFGGRRDPFGGVAVAGWRGAGLPVE
jgi:rhodanese-related sulfurtransferase